MEGSADLFHVYLLKLMLFLNTERPNSKPHNVAELKRYYKIISRIHSAYCFIVKEDFENKTVGKVKRGDLLYPASWQGPAKHTRGSIFKPEDWPEVFGKWGMKTLR